MSGFKLLAIRPMKDCDPKFLKNLKEGMLYKFYQDYDYYVKNNGAEIKLTTENYESYKDKPVIRVDSTEDEVDLYSSDNLRINISAIVGKNGSGKSALTEVFLKVMFDLSIQEEWITSESLRKQNNEEINYITKRIKVIEKSLFDINYTELDETKKNDLVSLGISYSEYKKALKNIKNHINKLDSFKTSSLFFELFLKIGENVIIVRRYNKRIFDPIVSHQNKLQLDNASFIKQINQRRITIENLIYKEVSFSFKELFYTVFLNYSIYGLNKKEIGGWIDYLYHKNDGYKTPVVINPQKNDGNIDVNKEEELSRYRVNRPAIVLGEVLSLKVVEIKFSMKKRKYNYTFEYDWHKDSLIVNNTPDDQTFVFNKGDKTNIEFLEKIFNTEINIKEISHDVLDFIVEYFLGKLFKMNYIYSMGEFEYDEIDFEYKIQNLTGFCDRIFKSTSHKFLKLKQLIDLVKNKNKIIDSIQEYGDEWISFKDFKGLIINAEEENLKISFSSIYDIDYRFEDGSMYSNFSSGQKQLVNTIETINYHIRNLASNKDEFHLINIILDEIELYFHPEYQRQFIHQLINSIKSLELPKEFKINILLLTHSPFILSDIPSSNILRLKEGSPVHENLNQTFGANIHDLLANDFFLDKGFMGEFAKGEINKTIVWLNEQKELKDDGELDLTNLEFIADKKIYKGIIELIGERVLKIKLIEMLSELEEDKVEFKEMIQREISRLNKLINE